MVVLIIYLIGNIFLINPEEEEKEEKAEIQETSYVDINYMVNFQKKQRKFAKNSQSSVHQISRPIFYFRKS